MWGKREKRLELPIRKYPAVSVYFRVWGERLPVADKLRTDRADRRDRGVGQNTSGTLQLFLAVSACGSGQKADRVKPSYRKKQVETLSTISTLICGSSHNLTAKTICTNTTKTSHSHARLCQCAVDTKKIFLPNWSLYSNSQHRFLSCDKPNLITCAPNMIKFHIILYRTIFSLKILLLQIFNLIYIRNIGKQTIIQFQLGVSPLEIP